MYQCYPEIRTIHEQFEIPQLIKTRRITALLPWNYEDSERRYPVLYLQDGQNLFDDYAPFGSWELDKKLMRLAKEGKGDFIVIAIDHAHSERIAEYTPSVKTKLGKGDGLLYADFLATTLKPHVDAAFRTLPGREHTGIGGSSMGGLISLYAAMKHPHVYSRLMLFSPSLWVSPGLPAEFLASAPDFSGSIYLYGGAREGSNMVEHLMGFDEKLHSMSDRIHYRLSIRDDGEHNEAAWGVEFPKAAEFLFTPRLLDEY
jgi:predicted alpha/beta superfamily hydrolase